MQYLVSFDSPWSAWLGTEWCKTIMTMAQIKIPSPADLFDELDTRGAGRLQSSSMLGFLHKVASFKKPKDSKAALHESMRTYMLFRHLDNTNNGEVSKEEFVSFFTADSKSSSSHCPKGNAF